MNTSDHEFRIVYGEIENWIEKLNREKWSSFTLPTKKLLRHGINEWKSIGMYRDEWKGQENQAKATYQRNWLAVPPRRKDQRGKKSKAVRPNLMEKTPYSRIKPPREENLKIFKKFQEVSKISKLYNLLCWRSFLQTFVKKRHQKVNKIGIKLMRHSTYLAIAFITKHKAYLAKPITKNIRQHI